MSDQETIFSKHSSKQFNEDLEGLRTEMLSMGGLVESQIQGAIEALLAFDADRAKQVQDLDKKTNKSERDINRKCIQIIALRQPAAVDLRLLMSINRAIVDLERIGDEASRIAKHSIELFKSGLGEVGMVEMRHIGQLVQVMLKDALIAFARRDMELAYSVVKRDDQVDKEYGSEMRSLITYMMGDPRSISGVMSLIWVLRSLERIGDHTCNLAEQLVYQVSGQDVTHQSRDAIGQLIDD